MKNWLTWTLIQGSNACNIFVGVILARALTPADFGRFATMSASLAIYTALLNPLINELAHSVSRRAGIDFRALKRRTISVGLVGILLSALTCFSITDTSPERFVVLIALPLSLLSWSWMSGILIGRNDMALLARAQCAGSLVRLAVICTALALSSTLLNIAIAYTVSFLSMTLVASPSTFRLQSGSPTNMRTNWRLIIGFFLLAGPFSLDQPLIQLWFSTLSGQYAAIMTYAKGIMLLSSPALTIAYSTLLQHREARASLTDCAKISTVVMCVAGFFWLFSPVLFPLLLGPQYVELLPYVGYALAAISLHVMVYAVAQRQLISGSPGLILGLTIPLMTQALYLKTVSEPSMTELCSLAIVVFAMQLVVVLGSVLCRSKRGHV